MACSPFTRIDIAFCSYKKGKVVFTINPAGKVYSLDLSSPSNCKVAEGVSTHSNFCSCSCSNDVILTISTLSAQDIFGGKADLQVICSEEVMGKMINKEIQPQQAFMKGMLKIKGKMNLAMKLTAVLAATRKKLPSSKL